jgi:hypothetical protein
MSLSIWKPNRFAITAFALVLMLGATCPAAAEEEINGLSSDQRAALSKAVGEWIKAQTEGSENADGEKTKRGHFSRDFRRADDGSYRITVHMETAGDVVKTTERYLLSAKEAGGAWEITGSELQDTFAGLFRQSGMACTRFDSMKFDRVGLELNASGGMVCKKLFQDGTDGFDVHAESMTYSYQPPAYATELHLQPDMHALHKVIEADHKRELEFNPTAFLFGCDNDTCLELLEECFTGLDESWPISLPGFRAGGNSSVAWLSPILNQQIKERQANPFVHFREPARPGNKNYDVFIPRELDPFTYPGFEEGLFDFSGALPGPGVLLSYDNWGGYEVTFNAFPRRVDDPSQILGALYGYYTEETQNSNTPYQLETRDDLTSRWHQVYKVDGQVDMGLEDPEILAADIEFGIELKHPLRILPFFIQSIPTRDFTGSNKSRQLFVNSVQLDGEELTWVRTSQLGGLVILPEEMPAGSKIDLRMEFKTRAMVKYTHSFIAVSRFGWMPFVRFGDFIDEFKLTVRAPAEFKVLGIGHVVEEETADDITTTHWVSESPVVFPSMTLGKYKSDTAGKKFKPAEKLDGTPIPVVVHVDEASAQDWDITTAKLRPIAQQATNSINLYREISGLDYPYGKLYFVNDPQGFLYGQAHSSLIYLGQGVFRGEGYLAPFFPDATGIAKFLKSVVAHETGHQWWGSRVSNANNRNYWFVESLAEYFSALYLEAVYGKNEYLQQVEEWRRNILESDLKASVQNASAIWPGEGGFGPYVAAVYNKGPFAFHMLREIFGDEKFFVFLKAFSQELDKKREIVTLDIQHAAENNLGGVTPDGTPYAADLGWFFDQWIRGSGVPQYRLDYKVRQAEDRSWIIEGTVEQRVLVGNKRDHEVLDNQYYRGVADITVKTAKSEYVQRMLIEGQTTPLMLKVPEKPLEVILNKENDILAHDVLMNQGEWQ